MKITELLVLVFMLLGYLSIVIGAFLIANFIGFIVLGFALLVSANILNGVRDESI